MMLIGDEPQSYPSYRDIATALEVCMYEAWAKLRMMRIGMGLCLTRSMGRK